ncbi:uncharacterized protein LOC127748664 [Frankliniella occidentalis]|uniref:Uncharacterized protein LOC127748664 n=1 Tax=Frankliniella occidentalis TaxID=133901 RepID=A0A9C6XQD1_FRAOC|nr:uncharacterized protein LOC127748664 [Frankliniella occidentalis]
MLVSRLLVAVALLAAVDAWKWKSLFDDSDADSVVTVAADGRAVFPVFRTYSGYRTLLLRLPVSASPDYGPALVTRVRHVYSLPPPLPPPRARYGPPVAAPSAGPGAGANPHSAAAATAAAVAASVARTILEVRSKSMLHGSRKV